MGSGLQRELNSRLLAQLDNSRSASIDGLRHEVDFEVLSSAFGTSFYMVFLEADSARRFQRLRSRFSTETAFRVADSQPVESHIDRLKSMANVTIETDGPLECLYKRLDAWIATCGKEDAN